MKVGDLVAALMKLDPKLPVVMELQTPESAGQYEVADIVVETARFDADLSYGEVRVWECVDRYEADRDSENTNPVALLSFDPPARETIDADIEQGSIEPGVR